MAWDPLPIFADGNILAPSQMNAMSRSIGSTAPAVARQVGGLIYGSGVGEVSEFYEHLDDAQGDDVLVYSVDLVWRGTIHVENGSLPDLDDPSSDSRIPLWIQIKEQLQE